MRKVLVLGGTRFFGKQLVDQLIKRGDEVTIATRGDSGKPFGNRVQHLNVDRFHRGSMERTFQDGEWDVIYDQIGFSPDDMTDVCEIFSGRTGRFIFTSSLSVYPFKGNAAKKEEDFDPYNLQVGAGRKDNFSYAEGKRQAEAALLQTADFPAVAVRPPIVLGETDYTERLHFHVRETMNQQPAGIDYPDNHLSFIHSEDLASFLLWAGDQAFTGPVNASSPDHFSLQEMMTIIGEKTGESPTIEPAKRTLKPSPMNFPVSYYQDVSLAESYGYQFKRLREWFPALVKRIYEYEKTN
ncbi:NAD-dependent epimerase/dehydratase family protein [Salisediminibacterium halotolerans]|uniref:Nucleoside-diphosphate-sugar epimerase n=1 Tax=Salisediminibacterium halotolerans TaxID=517425 RepID=A0A1H9TIF7_9BACI|nr:MULTISPECIES: NAD-dependent epimerase/dehydratase family protein [Salisediminibacterium]RLJ72373.1 nucleoside-diphosphate-sugar epimerase [Actinophytocola xinjiangensis]RPE85588.1 nucleoside-diphosphate-sugar epimerase [Salisediminibacterium halotolerans]TWG33542.1 nucleoside-diphosphate-sugar epimerase [Salisediminibacterium halotolerans]SER96962.1 Nucleoside-diphosphate-sugar epimerase [Salisediminibacterium haloalkalitolerans]GEL08741.1 NAD dependent epimerase/dehydratase [Salisediminiba